MKQSTKKKPVREESFQTKRKKMKTVLLQMQNNFSRPSFPNSFPYKKWSEHHSYRASTKNIYPEQQNPPQKQKVATERSSSIPIDLECLQQFTFQSTNKTQQSQLLSLDKMFSNKLKYKIKRNAQLHRQNTIHSENGQGLSPKANMKPEKKINNIIFSNLLGFQEGQQRQILKSPNVYLRTSEGRRQKVDGYMYLRKIKAKCMSRQRNLSICQTAHNQNNSQRALYTKSDQSEGKKKFYLTSYTNISKKKIKIVKKEDYSEQKIQCRPWSANKSEHNLD